ncbi:MAG: FHA domain-containing protein [Candidatus Acidiferrum sp.]
MTGQQIPLGENRTLTVGRTPKAEFAVPGDNLLSGVHFRLEWDGKQCRLYDQKSTNGTRLNGTRVSESALKNGDEISAGSNVFVFRCGVEQEHVSASLPTASGTPIELGSWRLRLIPPGWELLEGHGIRDANKDAFPSSIILGQDTLQPNVTLAQYIQAQLTIIRMHMPQARAKDVAPASFPPAEEAASLEIELPTPEGRPGVQRQLYARFGSSVGVITFTTLASDLSRLDPLFNSIRDGLSFRAE